MLSGTRSGTPGLCRASRASFQAHRLAGQPCITQCRRVAMASIVRRPGVPGWETSGKKGGLRVIYPVRGGICLGL